jgi:4-hydroxy-tetrahydrodipicolinate reductase
MTTINVAVAGAGGRMGRMLIEAVLAGTATKLAAALERQGDPHVGKDAGELVGSTSPVPKARSSTLQPAAKRA